MSIHESTAAYLLNALDDEERTEFEAHLASCDQCRREVAELQLAADALPMAVDPVPPPEHLKHRIMATVNSEAELLAAAGPEADRPVRPAPRRRLRWRGLPSLAAAAACVAAVVVSFAVVGGDERRSISATAAPADARVSLEVADQDTRLVAENLPAPPAGRVYQVWILRPGGDPEPTDALFRPRAGRASVDIPRSLEGVEAVLVTHEPADGSRAPTTAPLIEIRTAA